MFSMKRIDGNESIGSKGGISISGVKIMGFLKKFVIGG
jgi:hypothetical protein